MNVVTSLLAPDVSGRSHVAGWKTGRTLYPPGVPYPAGARSRGRECRAPRECRSPWGDDTRARLRDIAASLNITERSAFGILTNLVEAGYVVKEKNGRRNRYHVQAHLPLPEPDGRERTVGEILNLLTGTDAPAT